MGEHGDSWIEDQVFVDHPGAWLARQAIDRGWKRFGVYGVDYIMQFRDYAASLDGAVASSRSTSNSVSLAPSRARQELDSVRASVRIKRGGVRAVLEAYGSARPRRRCCLRPSISSSNGELGRTTMDMVLVGPGVGDRPVSGDGATGRPDVRTELEVAGGGHWVELSRPYARTLGKATSAEVVAHVLVPPPGVLRSRRRLLRPGVGARRPSCGLEGFIERGFTLWPCHEALRPRHDDDRASLASAEGSRRSSTRTWSFRCTHT